MNLAIQTRDTTSSLFSCHDSAASLVKLHPPWLLIKGKPRIGHPADHGSFSGHPETPDGLAGERVWQQGKFLAFQLTPAAAMPVGMPNQVHGALPHPSPLEDLHYILRDIDFHQRAPAQRRSPQEKGALWGHIGVHPWAETRS
jgi:hypothetical protein